VSVGISSWLSKTASWQGSEPGVKPASSCGKAVSRRLRAGVCSETTSVAVVTLPWSLLTHCPSRAWEPEEPAPARGLAERT